VETGNCSFSSPTIAPDGTVFIGSNDGKLYAVSADGHIRMTLATGGGVASSPTLGADGTLYVGTDHKTVVVVSPSGQVIRELLTDGPVRGAVAATPTGDVLVPSEDGSIDAFDAHGALLWKTKTTSVIESSPEKQADESDAWWREHRDAPRGRGPKL
jgi:outer membrane protein assembly factor BamB